MILFSDANGTIQTNFGTPVYQGSANSNIIYLIAPYAPAASVLVGFQLPDGSAVAPVAMTPLNVVPGVQNANGTSYAGWSYVLPATVTAKYGTVTAQFFFYSPTGQSTNPTSIIATPATSFQIGRGAAAVLPDTPDADVYESILSNLAQLQTDLNGGYYGARAIFPWSNGATYGLNEITFYPYIGTYGAFVQSVVAGNTNNVPYVDGAINSAYWKEVVNFNTVTEDYFQQVQAAVAQAESAATEAESSASAAANSATQAGIQNSNAQSAAFNASQSAQAAANSATAASTSASQSAASATQSQNSAEQSGNYAGNAQTSAQNAADSATAAQGYAQQAQQYAQKHYQVVASVAELPRPGDSAFIYLVPTGSGTSNDSYSEYLWITESNDYEFIGTTADIDLSNYAQINGTYAGMTVGNATNAQTATNAQQLGGVAAANYAQTNGTYSGMTVGKATNADNATKATQDASGNVITATYATKAENNAKYTKPSTGIPETDLASAVQTSLNKADTALQSVPIATSSKVGGVKPTSKTTQMTQSVGVDSNGALWTVPASGGIEQNEVIAVKSLPTATADSPDFVQTLDGKLYRKKSSQTNGVDNTKLQGTWKIKPTSNVSGLTNFNTEMKVNVSAVAHAFDEDLFGFMFSGQTFSTFNYYVEPFTLCDNGTWQIRDDIEFYAAADNLSYKTELLAVMNQCYTKQTSSIITTYSYEEVGASGTEVVANPTATGTQDLTSLQVGETVYNIPQGSGGITNAEVIEYAEELPTASETSPNFIQTPDGTLYRKKSVESIAILGTWVFNSNINKPSNIYVLSFTSNRNEYTQIGWRVEEGLYYQSDAGPDTVYIESSNSWVKEGFRTINITDISSLKNVDEFTQWLTANATKQGGGASVTYGYVAMQEVPTPTTADNGKVLGVANGAYALQEASGGGGAGYTVEFYDIYKGTVIYADGSNESLSGTGTKNNVRMIVGLYGNQNSWNIQNAVCLYNGQVEYGISTIGDAKDVDLVIPVNNECHIESWPD